MVDILLPETAISVLPFSAEPMTNWKRSVDVRQFIDALYEDIYPPFSKTLYDREKKDMRAWSKRFSTQAKKTIPSKSPSSQDVSIPDFAEDMNFGKMAKYVIAWKSSVQTVLEEAGFYSLAHILEADGEIDCSLLLASNLYYKQAVQVLRSFIEETFIPINFCENVEEYNQWKANSYHIPPLRGRDGLIKKLVNKGIITQPLGNEISDLYGGLNGFIHGSEDKLIYKGIFTGSKGGLQFKISDYESWCDYLARSIYIGIRLLRINYVQWERIRSVKRAALKERGKILCSVCHNEEDYDVTVFPPEGVECDVLVTAPDGTQFKADKSFPGVIQHIYRCKHCGQKTTIDPNPSTTAYHIDVALEGEVNIEDIFS